MSEPQKLIDQLLADYDLLASGIYRFCYVKTYNRQQSEDITQESFIKTWKYLNSGKSIENIKAFLYKVARNLIIDQSRKKKELSLDELAGNGFDHADESLRHMTSAIHAGQIMKVMDKLDPKYKDAVMLRYVEDLKPSEIAEIIGESENVASVRIHRGLEQLREILATQEQN